MVELRFQAKEDIKKSRKVVIKTGKILKASEILDILDEEEISKLCSEGKLIELK